MEYSASLEKSKNNLKKLYTWCFILYVSISLYTVAANKFVYWLEKYENTKILFYEEIQKNNSTIEKNDREDYFYVYYNVDSNLFNGRNPVYTYETDNCIGFELLNNFLEVSESAYISGKIECSFEVLYFIKLIKDIPQLPNNLNNNQFKYLLLTLKYLKAIENKNILKLLECLFLKIYVEKNSGDLKKKYMKYEDLFSLNYLSEINFYLKKNIISAFLNTLMVNYVFYENNLILLGNTNVNFDVDLFNEHIPYKNLLVNDYKVFCILENLLSNSYISNTFRVLLNKLDIESLIINNYFDSESRKTKFYFFNKIVHIFKSIIISNIQISSEILIYELNKAKDINIEYFTLKNSIIESNDFFSYLKLQRLKGLIFNNVIMDVYIRFLENCMKSNDTLEYIEFKNMEIGFRWWIEFTRISNIHYVIFYFDSPYVAHTFIREFSNMCLKFNVLHLEIWFDGLKIPPEFCNSLRHCKSLKTLKLLNCFLDKKIEPYLYCALKDMKELETLFLQSINLSDSFYEFLFQKKGIKILNLKNSCFPRNILRLQFLNNYKAISHLILINIKISEDTLIEIFKLEKLKVLSLKFCGLVSIKNLKSFNFISKNIKKLNLTGSDINISDSYHILTKLDNLDSLHLSNFQFHSSCLTKLNHMCNIKLKTLSYKCNSLYGSDLNRIKYLRILEKLNFYKCKFVGSSFYELGKECRFFNSLKQLNLGCVSLCFEDFNYLRNFKRLKSLEISLYGIHLVQLKFNTIYSVINRFYVNFFLYEIDKRNLSECFKEEDIEEICKWLI